MLKEQARALLRSVIRGALGTQDVQGYLRLHRLVLEKRLYRQPFTLDELRAVLVKLGFVRGRVVWVHSSWNEFYNLSAKPSEVIALMRDLLGPDGTLVMPAFPADSDPSKVLEIDFAPSSTGLLTEIFRRGRDVKRSIHLTSSVCAAGPAADFLVRDHHHDLFPWGVQTPYCRAMDVDARIVGLGVGQLVRYLTPLHAVECLLYDEVPFFQRAFDGTIRYQWRRRNGEEGSHEFMARIGRLNFRRYNRHFPKDLYVRHKISNLDTFAIDAKVLINHALDLGRRGITLYDESSLPAVPRQGWKKSAALNHG